MPKHHRRLRTQSHHQKQLIPKPNKKTKQQPRPPPPLPLPFNPTKDHILLIGEGNLSFAQSLLKHHQCRHVTATTFDTECELFAKYGEQVRANIAIVRSYTSERNKFVSCGEVKELDPKEEDDGDDIDNNDEPNGSQDDEIDFANSGFSSPSKKDIKLLFGIDATRLSKFKQLKNKQFDVIIFNFPHVGGLTKDQDRQIRANQELLLSFFQSAVPLLSPSGSIVLTLFTGKPYELWDVKSLAKSCNLRSRRSFKFDKEMYPGYEHARTIGAIHGKGDGGRVGWKGEERDARCFIFEKNDGTLPGPGNQSNGKKRKRGAEESSDDES